MKIGDRVKFKGSNEKNYIPNYYTEDSGIPTEMIRHGNTQLSKEYYKDFAKIVNFFRELVIVEYEDNRHHFVRLGFKEENLELIKPLSWREEMSL
jgi:hypothetical protein